MGLDNLPLQKAYFCLPLVFPKVIMEGVFATNKAFSY